MAKTPTLQGLGFGAGSVKAKAKNLWP